MPKLLIVLDAGGIFLLIIPILFLVFMAGVTFLEAWFLFLFKYDTYKRSLLHSMIINLASLVCGFFVSPLLGHLSLLVILYYFLITVVVEAGVLLALSKARQLQRTLIATVVMNVVSYLILSILFFGLELM